MDRLKEHGLSPLFYSGDPPAFAADAALSRNLPFTVRLMPSNEQDEFTLPKKQRTDGGEFPNILGEYNKTVTTTVVATNPGVRIGSIPAGSQWPLFNTAFGQYPPLNFGDNGFNGCSPFVPQTYEEATC